MASTYRCRDCGYTTTPGAGIKPKTCLRCGGSDLTAPRAPRPPRPHRKAAAPKPPKEGQ